MIKTTKLLTLFAALLIISCSGPDNGVVITPDPVETIALKEAAGFPIGNVASAGRLASDATFTRLLNKEFNSITAENDMKMASMFTGPDTYDFSKGDAIVSYAKANGFRVHGHTLVWHASIPNWLKNYSGTDAQFEEQVKKYIKATVAHFAETKTTSGDPVVQSWDVVNEALTSDATNGIFNQRIGSDYVAKCFTWAREADPDVKLFYNDYSLGSQSSKVAMLIDMVNSLKANSIPIDGIGMQMHVDYQYPDLTILADNLQTIINTGLLIHFSELDMTVNKDKTLTSLTSVRATAQKEQYNKIAALYKTIPASQQYGITFWGMRDNDSWLINFLNNPNEWPLLFDSKYGYKAAYTGFLEGIK